MNDVSMDTKARRKLFIIINDRTDFPFFGLGSNILLDNLENYLPSYNYFFFVFLF